MVFALIAIDRAELAGALDQKFIYRRPATPFLKQSFLPRQALPLKHRRGRSPLALRHPELSGDLNICQVNLIHDGVSLR